ncbi:D-ribose pyranase [Halocella sp. SP3-1]|uniref:D-ribose pyranase n=1 Tax=Halocella sp. SP3-1 TaxID=2382161 RepID=UPI000F762386|nr:D-ribose pyranase [Halocella sp. SP3-1]AZO95815.1 D-ribose pyranase [Halocella sp. SP3-1]
MKKRGILNDELSYVLAQMGHTDKIVIADAGLPIPETTKRIDLALKRGIPRFITVLKSVLEELVVEKIVLAQEIKEKSPHLEEEILSLLDSNIKIEYISHQDFKEITKEAKAVVRSGETTPYANIILLSGVNF